MRKSGVSEAMSLMLARNLPVGRFQNFLAIADCSKLCVKHINTLQIQIIAIVIEMDIDEADDAMMHSPHNRSTDLKRRTVYGEQYKKSMRVAECYE